MKVKKVHSCHLMIFPLYRNIFAVYNVNVVLERTTRRELFDFTNDVLQLKDASRSGRFFGVDED